MIMKKLNILLSIFASLLLLGACSPKDNSDLEHLLSSVPSDASAVVVMSLPDMLREAGCKIASDGALTLPPELARAFAANRDLAPLGKALEKGESGLMAAPIVWFTEGDVFYFTGLLSDPAAFRQFAAEQQGEEFTDEQGVSLCGYIAVKGNQFWYSRSSLGSKEINRFSGLDAKRSYLANDGASLLTDDDSDIRGIFDVNSLLRQTVAAGSRPMAQLAVATLFKDAEYASLEVDFDKGEVEAEVKVLDSKMRPTRFLLPADRISEKTVLALGETADAVIGINISKKLVSTILDKGAALIPRQAGEVLAPVDGTLAYSSGDDGETQALIITTDGSNASPLAALLGQYRAGDVTTEGKELIARKGKTAGPILVKDAADILDDAFAGIVATPHALTDGNAEPGIDASKIRTVSLLLKPEDGSLKLTAEIRFDDRKGSGLVQFLNCFK